MLTNVGLLVFDNKNLTKPSRIIPLYNMKLITKNVDKRNNTFGLKLASGELVILAAADRATL